MPLNGTLYYGQNGKFAVIYVLLQREKEGGVPPDGAHEELGSLATKSNSIRSLEPPVCRKNGKEEHSTPCRGIQQN